MNARACSTRALSIQISDLVHDFKFTKVDFGRVKPDEAENILLLYIIINIMRSAKLALAIVPLPKDFRRRGDACALGFIYISLCYIVQCGLLI